MDSSRVEIKSRDLGECQNWAAHWESSASVLQPSQQAFAECLLVGAPGSF